ncbi:MAG: hypothetical protein NZ534_00115 [Bacteroidia bacterium]|nr:hypothetical protein [Bacteroidia bacterium]
MKPFPTDDAPDDGIRRIYDPQTQKIYEGMFRTFMTDEMALIIARQSDESFVSAKFSDRFAWIDGRINMFIEARDANGAVTVIEVRI